MAHILRYSINRKEVYFSVKFELFNGYLKIMFIENDCPQPHTLTTYLYRAYLLIMYTP